jgi:hypothetical protein
MNPCFLAGNVTTVVGVEKSQAVRLSINCNTRTGVAQRNESDYFVRNGEVHFYLIPAYGVVGEGYTPSIPT